MQTQVDELTELVKTLRAAQNQPPPPPPPVRTQAEACDSANPDWEICFESPTSSTPPRSAPWFPLFTSGEILRPIACEPPAPTFQTTARPPPPGLTHHQSRPPVPTFQPTTHTPPPVSMHHQSEPPLPTVQHAIFVPPLAATQAQATMTYSAPTIHTVPQNK